MSEWRMYLAERGRLQLDSQALERIKAATQAAGWPVGETLDDLVAAVAAVSAGRDALAADHARMAAERDALAADNARLLAELADRVDGDGERVAERERLERQVVEATATIDSISKALRDAGYAHEADGHAPGHRDAAEVVECLGMALHDLAQQRRCHEEMGGALHGIHQALARVGRRDVGRHPAAVACAVEEALLDLSARWRGRDEALEQIREAMGMAPSSPADIADIAVQMITLYRWRAARAVDVLPDAPATGGDCGGEA